MENTSGFKIPAVSGTQPWGWAELLLSVVLEPLSVVVLEPLSVVVLEPLSVVLEPLSVVVLEPGGQLRESARQQASSR
jgi:hypothetical protein